MRQVIVALLFGSGALALAGCDEPDPIPQSSGATVQNALLDTSVVGTTVAGNAYCAYHSNTRGLRGTNGQDRFSGTWEIKQDNICYGLANTRTECQYAKVEEGKIFFYNRLDGRLITSGTLTAGDACS